jgi:hypothetical protein
MAAQPGLHRLQPVVLGRLGELAFAHRAGQFGIDPVPRGQQLRGTVEQLRAEHGREVVGRQGVQGRGQLAHDTSRSTRTHVRSLSPTRRHRKRKAQVSTVLRAPRARSRAAGDRPARSV